MFMDLACRDTCGHPLPAPRGGLWRRTRAGQSKYRRYTVCMFWGTSSEPQATR